MHLRRPIVSALLALALLPARAAGLTQLIQSIPRETPLAHPDLAFAKDAWIQVIRGAKSRLDFAEFYIAQEPGGALEEVLQELERAGARGVKIRFILSAGRMLEQDPASVARLRRVKNLELRTFDLKGISTGILHAKYFLADGREGVLGSQNFDWRALEHIHELGIRTTDPALVDRLQEVFEVDWRFAGDKSLPPAARPVPAPLGPAELVASPPFLSPGTVRPALDALVQLLGEARSSIRVQLLTYSPVARNRYWPALDTALRAAAVRGVKVDLLVSDWVFKSRGLDHLKSLALIPNIDVRIASIPEASTGHIPFSRTIHSKYVVIDGAVLWVGTSNWEEDYFQASRNVEAILRQPDLARQGGEIYEKLWTSPYVRKLEPMKAYAPRKVD
ncbi:phospholipase D-like domain-containing protein [Mesoterricola silvestris]|uniref:Phospholipase n=1 Tax=Mesoterricola silvestris TaxID=2927979 RepID=A0AA48GNB2_9BACT|nr:phospholipase D-like domain-containing protein [Mesoterricola silvestris]BDU74499.1 phospholipase [Mesoterricola silvestris]